MSALRVTVGMGAAALLSAALFAQTSTPRDAADAPSGSRAITGMPTSARHCVAGSASNVHALGWIQEGAGYTIRFDSDIALSTRLVRMDLEQETSSSISGDPDFNFTASSSGTMALFVNGRGRSGCYRYKVEVDPSAEGVAASGTRAAQRLVKPPKNPIRTMAIAGLASNGQQCVGGNFVSKVQSLGWVGEGASVRITFDSDFDPIAGAALVDPVGERSRWITNDDSGGDLEPVISFTAPIAGTVALFVASGDGTAGCYNQKVEIEGGTGNPNPTPSPTPAPTPSPSPTPSPTPSPAPGNKRTYKAVWVNASWSGGRTGTPLNSRGIDPVTGTAFGTLCPARSLTLENHPESDFTVDGNGFYVRNGCATRIVDAVFCRTSGSGGGASSIPVCATDPRETPSSNVKIMASLPTGNGKTFVGTTPVNLDINVFWCSDQAHFNFGSVRGISSLDCVED